MRLSPHVLVSNAIPDLCGPNRNHNCDDARKTNADRPSFQDPFVIHHQPWKPPEGRQLGESSRFHNP